MARNEQLIRQHKILQVLERNRFGRLLDEIRDEVVDELGLSSLHTRTIRRDLEALQAAGIDVDVHDEQRGKVWKLGPRAKTVTNITATASELVALSLGRDLLYPLAGTPFWQGIESFWNKVQDELPASVLGHYEKYRQILFVLGMPAKSYREHHGILKTINRSILEHRIVEIEYQSIGKPKRIRRIEPYAVAFYQSSLYIIAADNDLEVGQQRMRHWKLDRFEKATALDEWFKPDEAFNLDEYLQISFGIFSREDPKDYCIHISSKAAPWVLEDPWHPQQQIEQQDDGSIILTIVASHELEVIPKVLSLGANAEILSPPEARKTIAELIAEMATQYQ
ncbi:MAG: WYL domain-containing protein [bacterium]|nr:WYL domain-containing protein [bacterium]